MQTSSKPLYRILRLMGLKTKTGKSKSALYDIQNPNSPYYDGTFPKKCQLGARSVGWFEHEVDAWLLSRKITTPDPESNERLGGAK